MDKIEQKIIQAVDERREDIISFFADFVRCDSWTGNELGIATLLRDGMKARGFDDIQIVGRVPERPNVIAYYRGVEDGPTFTFNGHMDVLPPQDAQFWPHKPYDGDIVGNRIYGRGTVDMKGGTFGSFIAALIVQQLQIPIRGKCLFTAVCDEEVSGHDGIDWLIKEGYVKKEREDDFGLNCEPSNMNECAVATKGVMRVKVEIKGKGCFNARPWLGISAIDKAAKFIEEVRLLQEKLNKDPKQQHKYLTPGTSAVGIINGGVDENLVPDRVYMTCMRRLLPGEVQQNGIDEYQEIVDRLHAEDPDFIAELTPTTYRPSAEVDEDLPVIDAVRRALKLVTGDDLKLVGSEGGTDASNVLAYTGIQMPIFGPGDDPLIGTVDEYLEFDDLINAIKIYALTIYYMLGIK